MHNIHRFEHIPSAHRKYYLNVNNILFSYFTKLIIFKFVHTCMRAHLRIIYAWTCISLHPRAQLCCQ